MSKHKSLVWYIRSIMLSFIFKFTMQIFAFKSCRTFFFLKLCLIVREKCRYTNLRAQYRRNDYLDKGEMIREETGGELYFEWPLIKKAASLMNLYEKLQEENKKVTDLLEEIFEKGPIIFLNFEKVSSRQFYYCDQGK